jgi:hypothetical protein
LNKVGHRPEKQASMQPNDPGEVAGLVAGLPAPDASAFSTFTKGGLSVRPVMAQSAQNISCGGVLVLSLGIGFTGRYNVHEDSLSGRFSLAGDRPFSFSKMSYIHVENYLCAI